MGNRDNLLWEEPVSSRFSAVAKTCFSPLAIILQGGRGRLARVHDVEDPPLDLNKGRLASDHGAGGGPLPRAQKKSSKLELKGEVGRSRVARVVRTSRRPVLPCCRVRGTRRGSGTKFCENMNFYKCKSIMR